MSTIAPYQPTFRDALRETGQYLTGGIQPMEAGLSTTVATEPIKNWAGQQGPVGRFASNFIPGTREEVISAAAQAALLAMTMGASGAAGAAGRTGGAGMVGRPTVTQTTKATPGALLEDPKRYASFMRSLGKPQKKFSPLEEAFADTVRPWGPYTAADFESPLIEHVKKAGLGLAMDAAAYINKVGPQNLDDTARRLRVAFGGRDYLTEPR